MYENNLGRQEEEKKLQPTVDKGLIREVRVQRRDGGGESILEGTLPSSLENKGRGGGVCAFRLTKFFYCNLAINVV